MDTISREVFSVDEFCVAHNISRAFLYKLWNDGRDRGRCPLALGSSFPTSQPRNGVGRAKWWPHKSCTSKKGAAARATRFRRSMSARTILDLTYHPFICK